MNSLTSRQRLTWLAHMWKALTQQHHTEMRPRFRPYIPPDGVVMDVGAHAGQYTKLFAAMLPHGHVHAFEPGGYALSLLRRVKSFRRLSNITIHPYGLGDLSETSVLNVPIKESGSVGFGLSFVGDQKATTRRTAAETIEIRRLDDVVQEHRISRVDFIKLDIEGSELRMLVGAKVTLLRFTPTIFVELVDQNLVRRGDSVEALSDFLRDLGYSPIGGWETYRPKGDRLFTKDTVSNLA